MYRYNITYKPLSDTQIFIIEKSEDKDYEYQRIFDIDLNYLINYNFTRNFDHHITELNLIFENVGYEVKKIPKKKCMKCKKSSETTYCKKCWSEMY